MSESQPRSVQMSPELLRGMAFDAVVYTVTRPLGALAYLALAGALVFTAFALPQVTALDPERATSMQWTLVLIVAFVVASLLFTRASARRTISTAMPNDTEVSVRLDDEHVHIRTRQGRSVIPYDRFQSVRVGRYAVLLRLRGGSAITAIPRVLLDDEDIARLKAHVG